jgi:hypothetical protein
MPATQKGIGLQHRHRQKQASQARPEKTCARAPRPRALLGKQRREQRGGETQGRSSKQGKKATEKRTQHGTALQPRTHGMALLKKKKKKRKNTRHGKKES